MPASGTVSKLRSPALTQYGNLRRRSQRQPRLPGSARGYQRHKGQIANSGQNRAQYVPPLHHDVRQGFVRLYFDGQEVGSDRVQGLGGPVFSYYELRVGHDWWPPATESGQQLVGWVDDILVLPRALKDEEIAELCAEGAERYFKLTR